MLLALYEYPGALVSYEGFNNVCYATMLSGNRVKTLRCSYDELYEALRLTMLWGNRALVMAPARRPPGGACADCGVHHWFAVGLVVHHQVEGQLASIWSQWVVL